MITSLNVAERLLNLSEQQYFSDLDLTPFEKALARSDFEGLAINAPSNIDLERDSVLPMLVAIQQSGLRAWEINREDSTVVFAYDPVESSIQFGPVYFDPKSDIPPDDIALEESPAPTGADAISINTNIVKIDARELIGIKWAKAAYRMGVFNFDRVSNIVDVRLSSTNALYQQATSASVEFSVSSSKEEELVVKGTLRLSKNDMTIFDKDSKGYLHGKLVVLAKNSITPLEFDMKMDVESGSLANMEGAFSENVLEHSDYLLVEGDYVSYLFVAGKVFGPQMFEYK